MPTALGREYATDWRGKPAGMLDPDVPVWLRWLDKYSVLLSRIWYNVRLGGPWLTPEQEKDHMQVMWRATTTKRIDALAETPTEVWLIEVSAYPGQRSLGQLLSYQTLWLEDPKIIKPEKLLLVCERVDEDIGVSYAKFGIQVYIV